MATGNYIVANGSSRCFLIPDSRLDFSHYVAVIKPRSHRSLGAFFICEKFLSLLYLLVFFPDVLRSCDLKFVFRFWARLRCHGSVVEMSSQHKGIGNCNKSQIFVCGGAWKVLPKNLCAEKMPRRFIFISIKVLKR